MLANLQSLGVYWYELHVIDALISYTHLPDETPPFLGASEWDPTSLGLVVVTYEGDRSVFEKNRDVHTAAEK